MTERNENPSVTGLTIETLEAVLDEFVAKTRGERPSTDGDIEIEAKHLRGILRRHFIAKAFLTTLSTGFGTDVGRAESLCSLMFLLGWQARGSFEESRQLNRMIEE